MTVLRREGTLSRTARVGKAELRCSPRARRARVAARLWPAADAARKPLQDRGVPAGRTGLESPTSDCKCPETQGSRLVKWIVNRLWSFIEGFFESMKSFVISAVTAALEAFAGEAEAEAEDTTRDAFSVEGMFSMVGKSARLGLSSLLLVSSLLGEWIERAYSALAPMISSVVTCLKEWQSRYDSKSEPKS